MAIIIRARTLRRARHHVALTFGAALLASCQSVLVPFQGDDNSPPDLDVGMLFSPPRGAVYTDGRGGGPIGSPIEPVRATPRSDERRQFVFPLRDDTDLVPLVFVARDSRSGIASGRAWANVYFNCVRALGTGEELWRAELPLAENFTVGEIVGTGLSRQVPSAAGTIILIRLEDLWRARCQQRNGQTLYQGRIRDIRVEYGASATNRANRPLPTSMSGVFTVAGPGVVEVSPSQEAGQ
jgi:hypothetical protein